MKKECEDYYYYRTCRGIGVEYGRTMDKQELLDFNKAGFVHNLLGKKDRRTKFWMPPKKTPEQKAKDEQVWNEMWAEVKKRIENRQTASAPTDATG